MNSVESRGGGSRSGVVATLVPIAVAILAGLTSGVVSTRYAAEAPYQVERLTERLAAYERRQLSLESDLRELRADTTKVLKELGEISGSLRYIMRGNNYTKGS